MATSIHGYAEIKIKGSWHVYSKLRIDDSYEVFHRIGGINPRDYSEEPISPLKGLPEDISAVAKFDREWLGEDGHSETWFNAEEIARLELWITNKKYFGTDYVSDCFGYLFGNYWRSFFEHPEDRKVGLEDIRFVFWFDN